MLPQHQTQMDGTLFSQVQTLALEIKRLEAAHDQSEARVVRLSQNSDDYKRQVRQLHANIQTLGNVLKIHYVIVQSHYVMCEKNLGGHLRTF